MRRIIIFVSFLLLTFGIFNAIFIEEVEAAEYASPAWMDNEHIICVKYVDISKRRLFKWFGDITDAMYVGVRHEIQIVSMDIEGKNEKVIKNIIIDRPGLSYKWREEVFKGVHRIYDFSYNQNRKLIAFATHNGTKGIIFIMTLDGKVVKKIEEGGQPRWSLDGTKLLYASEGPIIWIWDITTDTNYKLIENAIKGVWSPDGKKIAFSRRVNHQHDVFIYDLETKEESYLEKLSKKGAAYVEDWSPDGKILAAQNGLFSLEGESLRIKNTPYNVRWSPDGKRIVGDATEEDYIAVVDSNGENLKILR